MNGLVERVNVLFDSGASISVMSDTILPQIVNGLKDSTVVQGIGGSQKTKEVIRCEINLDCGWKGIHDIKPTRLPNNPHLVILGRDVLSSYGNTEFNWLESKIRVGEDWIFVNDLPPVKSWVIDKENMTKEECAQINSLLKKYSNVFATNNKSPNICNKGVHVIKSLDDRVCKDKVRRLPEKWKAEVGKQVVEMLDNEIIKESASPYNSNVILAEKKDNTKRFVIDFRTLNKNTVQDAYPLPDVQDILDNCKDAQFLTQLDLASGYWGIQLDPKDSEKTAFSVPNGKYEFVRMPFGLKNSQATFQRIMDKLVITVRKNNIKDVDAYVDNIVIASKTFLEHVKALEEVLKWLTDSNLSLRADKCQLGFKEMSLLGYIINGQEIRPDPINVEKLEKFPAPRTKKHIQRFMGIANFNRKFIKNFSEITKPLTLLLSDKVKFQWEEAQQEAFRRLKTLMCKAPSLNLPDWKKPFCMETDASAVAVGAVLFQMSDAGDKLPIAYHSRTLSGNRGKIWSATEKELFAILDATRKWKTYCANKIIVFTDHKPLQYTRNMKDSRGKITRWVMELSELDYEIRYIKGDDNSAADALSRVEIPEDGEKTGDEMFPVEEYPDKETIRAHQQKDKTLKAAFKEVKRGKQLKKGPLKNVQGLRITEGLLMKFNKVVVPETLTERIVTEYHGQYHSGIDNTTMMIKKRFWWRGIDKEVEKIVGQCRTCSQCKTTKNPREKLQIPEEPEPRECIAMDAGSMPVTAEGFTGFLLVVDLATRFITATPYKNQTAPVIENIVGKAWISIFGVPVNLRSDQAKNMDGTVINAMCTRLGIKKSRSSPYHPEGNGTAERSVGKVKTMISSTCEARGIAVTEWTSIIGEVVLAINCSANRSLKCTPFEFMFGNNPGRLPIDNFMQLKSVGEPLQPEAVKDFAKTNVAEAKQQYKAYYDTKAVVNTYTEGQEVLVKRTYGKYPKLAPNWTNGPYHVVKKLGPVNYWVKNGKGKSRLLHHNMLKPALKEVIATKYLTPGEIPVQPDGGPTVSYQSTEEEPKVAEMQDTMDQRGFRGQVLQAPADHQRASDSISEEEEELTSSDSEAEVMPARVAVTRAGRAVRQVQQYQSG